MKFTLFYHSLVSDWNHGNAHFLRGVATELIERGHHVDIYEPENGWSLQNLIRDHGCVPLDEFAAAYPQLHSRPYTLGELNLDEVLDAADVVLVHEWNPPELIAAIGKHRRDHGGYLLFFHDTHHRAVTRPEDIAGIDLSEYDGVLAFGQLIRDVYLHEGWAKHAWTWHEAADARRFKPVTNTLPRGDLVWIGNWGDDERTSALDEFLLEPTSRLDLNASVYGVRYPVAARKQLKKAGIAYRGWVANYRVPEVFAKHRVTMHIPRRPYRESIPGIPTIRVFEALACGLPLVCVHWEDIDELFHPGDDYLVAQTGEEMEEQLRYLLENPDDAAALAERGRRTILDRHTCSHRVDELLNIINELNGNSHSIPERNNGIRLTENKR